MSSDSNTIHNQDEPTKPLIFPNVNSVVKLTGSNYQHWRVQLESLLVGYDLFHFIDGSTKSPPSTINDDENMKTPNPAFNTWFRQDKLLFGALVGTLSPAIGSLVTEASSSKEAWDILSTTYALTSRNLGKQLKFKLKNFTKGCISISHNIQKVDTRADESTQGTHEDIANKIIDTLDTRSQSNAVHGRDNPINKLDIQTTEAALVPAFPKQKMNHLPTPKQILGSSKILALGLLESMGTLAYFCAKLSSRASHKLARGTIKLRKHSRTLGTKMRRGGDQKNNEFGDGGLWRKTILMGDKCDPLNFSGVIYYDCSGNMLSEAPVKSPRASPFMGHGY